MITMIVNLKMRSQNNFDDAYIFTLKIENEYRLRTSMDEPNNVQLKKGSIIEEFLSSTLT
jgi:hypothetical protein